MRSWLLFAGALLLLTAGNSAAQTDFDDARKAAGSLVLDRLAAEDAAAHRRLRRCPRSAVLLVDGQHDHSDRVLDDLRVRYRRCTPSGFSRASLRGVRLLIVDCPGDLGRRAVRRVRDFVARGGTLLSTDWALLHLLEPAFPGRLRSSRRPAPDDVVRLSEMALHPFTRRVFRPDRPARWWIENRSHPVLVLSPEVVVLFRSREMEARYGSSVIGATFPWRRGTVVHLVSHLHLQRNRRLEDWERRSLSREIERLGFSPSSPAWNALRAEGLTRRVRAGDFVAAASVQQLVLNVLLHALGHVPAPTPPPPRPTPPPPVVKPTWHYATRATQLLDGPSGRPVLHVTEGLRLAVMARRDGWVRVRTPAGQEGWIGDGALR